MKKSLFMLMTGLVLSVASFAQVKWNADPAHTNARFSVKHLGISFVDGEFTKVSGTMETKSASDFTDAKINYTIDANSLSTRVDARDKHLKTDDFFNVEKYPTLSLKSISFKKVGNGKYKLIADLTIRDITKQVVFTVTENGGVIKDPWGMTRVGFTATTTVNRHDFGLKYNDKLPSGVEAVASMISIVVNTELIVATK